MPYDATKDRFASNSQTVIGQPRSATVVVPSDSTDLTSYAKALWFDAACTVVVLPVDNADGSTVTFAVPQGWFDMQVRRVLSTGTTASAGAIKAGY